MLEIGCIVPTFDRTHLTFSFFFSPAPPSIELAALLELVICCACDCSQAAVADDAPDADVEARASSARAASAGADLDARSAASCREQGYGGAL